MAQISAKNFDFWYMDGSLFLQNGYMDGWHFKNPSGTPLPRPKLSTPPGGHVHLNMIKSIRVATLCHNLQGGLNSYNLIMENTGLDGEIFQKLEVSP